MEANAMLARLGRVGAIPDKVKDLVSNVGANLAKARAEKRELAGEVEQLQGALDSLYARLPRFATGGVKSLATTGGGFAAGYLQEMLEERKAEKIGPLDAVPVLGFGASIAVALLVKDPDVAEMGSAFLSGMSAFGAGEMGRKKRREHRNAGAAKAAGEPAAAPAPKK